MFWMVRRTGRGQSGSSEGGEEVEPGLLTGLVGSAGS